MNTTNQTGRRGRYGTKEDQSPAVPSINQDETKDAFVARAKALGCKDAEIEAACSKANPPARRTS